MKKFWGLIVLFLVITGVLYYYIDRQTLQSTENSQFIYDQETQKWERYDSEDVVSEDRESIIQRIANAAARLFFTL